MNGTVKVNTFINLRAVVVTTALFFVSLVFLSFWLPGLEPYLPVLIVGVLFLGIPHGALDIFLLQRLARKDQNLSRFLALYIVALGMMAASWVLAPDGAFLFFAAYSCFHFAMSDVSKSKPRQNIVNTGRIEFLARFLTPFCIPFGFQSERSFSLARTVHDSNVFEMLRFFFQVSGSIALGLCLLVAVIELIEAFSLQVEWRPISVEPLLVALLFLKLDPLYAFGIYFCFVHSVKHIFNVLTSTELKGRVTFDLRSAAPYWLLPVFFLLILVVSLSTGRLAIEGTFIKWSMILISAIALPHTILIYLSRKRGLL